MADLFPRYASQREPFVGLTDDMAMVSIRNASPKDGLIFLSELRTFFTSTFVQKTGDTMTGPLTVALIGTATVTTKSDGTSGFFGERYSSDAFPPVNVLRKARGTQAAPAAVQVNDVLGDFQMAGHTGAGFVNGGWFRMTMIAAVPGPSDMEGRFSLFCIRPATVNGSETLRVEYAYGMSMYGANLIIDNNRIFRLRNYTIANLPSAATAAGQSIYCSNLGGGGGEVISDGTAWRRATDAGSGDSGTSSAFTLTVLVHAPLFRHVHVLTANRLITLSTTNAYSGARFRITKVGADAFSLDVGGLKTITTGQWCEVVFDGTAWYLSAYGTL